MRLLYLLTEPFGIGGVQSDVLTLTEDLTQRGHTVYVATAPGSLVGELTSKGARYVALDLHYRGPTHFARAAAALRRLVRDADIELVAPQSVRSTIAAWAALRLLPLRSGRTAAGRPVPIVTTIHNIHSPIHFHYAGHILQRCCDYVIFESHYERNRLLASGLRPEKSTVIHSGIDTDRFAPRPRDAGLAARYGIDPARHRVFGIVARLSEEKGHQYLVEAFSRVHRENPNTRLAIIGDGPLLEEVRAQVSALGLDRAVVFTGVQRNIADHLALLDAFVLSSTRESFPLAAREAMAAGKAVIAPRIGGCPEVVDDGVTGYLFESRDIAALAACMQRVIADGASEELGRAGREHAERLFSRRSWVDGDEQVYMRWPRA